MNFNIYLSDRLHNELQNRLQQSSKSRNALIREAIEQYLYPNSRSSWPQSVQQFKPVPDFPPFETHRSDIKANQNTFGHVPY